MRGPGSREMRRGRPQDRCFPLSRPDPSCTKRRIPDREEEARTVKHHLSEDEVSASLQRLSLENDHSYGLNGFPKMSPPQPLQPPESSSPDSSPEEVVLVDPGEFCMDDVKVLNVRPLLQETLQGATPDGFVSENILNLSSPCLELLIWSPPIRHIHRPRRSLSGPQNLPMKSQQAEKGMEL